MLIKKPSELVDEEQACPKELAEVPRLGQHGSGGLGHPVLDVPGGGHEVRRAAMVVLVVSSLPRLKSSLIIVVAMVKVAAAGGGGVEGVVFIL